MPPFVTVMTTITVGKALMQTRHIAFSSLAFYFEYAQARAIRRAG